MVDEETEEMMGTMRSPKSTRSTKSGSASRSSPPMRWTTLACEMVMGQEDINLAGTVKVWSEGPFPKQYKGLYFRPDETRRKMF